MKLEIGNAKLFLRRRGSRSRESGYMLLVIMLAMALLIIGLAAVARNIAQEIRHDKEEEMVHRGAQYARAIRRFYKKFGRYPSRMEELEDTNHMRFLRRRYKDPMTAEGDWRLLHFGDVKISFAPAIRPGTSVGPGIGPAGASPGGAQTTGQGAAGQTPGGPTSSGQPGPIGTPAESMSSPLKGPSFGGGPIVGVASQSDAQSIMEFDQKNHYKDWQFIYDPSSDRGGLIKGPYVRPLQGAVGMPGVPGTPGVPGATGLPNPMGTPAGPGSPMSPPGVTPGPR